MPLIKSNKLSRQETSDIIKKAKAPIVSKQVKAAGGISGAVSSMVAHAETKLGKYKEQYQVIRDLDSLYEYLHQVEVNGICAIDTETTGLDVFTVDLVGICLYTPNTKPAYVPVGHRSYVTKVLTKGQLTIEEVRKAFNGIRYNDVKWVMHNADYDIRILRHTMNLFLTCYWDTLVGEKMLDENQNGYSLKELHIRHCNSQDSEALSFNSLFSGVTFDNIPIDTAYLYAAGDAVKTFELYEYQKAEFEKPGRENLYSVFLDIEMPITAVVADMEDAGIAIDFDFASNLVKKYREKKRLALINADTAIQMYQSEVENYRARNPACKLDNPINLGSPTQLAILFYDILGLTSPDKKSPRGTGEEILKEFAKGKEKAICEAILEVRGVEKLLGTYIEKMPNLAQRDGRVHCRFNQLGARTGRFSSSEPKSYWAA